jgi:hypothetical protein
LSGGAACECHDRDEREDGLGHAEADSNGMKGRRQSKHPAQD